MIIVDFVGVPRMNNWVLFCPSSAGESVSDCCIRAVAQADVWMLVDVRSLVRSPEVLRLLTR